MRLEKWFYKDCSSSKSWKMSNTLEVWIFGSHAFSSSLLSQFIINVTFCNKTIAFCNKKLDAFCNKIPCERSCLVPCSCYTEYPLDGDGGEPLDGGPKTNALQKQSPEWLGIFALILGPVNKISLEMVWQTKCKICGN